MNQSHDERITSILGNHLLSSALHKSVLLALRSPLVPLPKNATVWDVFKNSLDVAIRDIDNHQRGRLFRRFVEFGPQYHDGMETKNREGMLTDSECGSCIEFIFSHMINRFKGELAELLALEPCILLIQRLQQKQYLSPNIQLYWGDMVQERRRTRINPNKQNIKWGAFAKGADGVLVEQKTSESGSLKSLHEIHGVVEVKSMHSSKRKVLFYLWK